MMATATKMVGAFAAAIALATSPTAAHASPTTTNDEPLAPVGVDLIPEVEAPDMFDPPTPSELEDIAVIAKDRGLTLDAAIDLLGWQRSFWMLSSDVEASYPDAFAGSAIDEDGSAWIAFKSAAPAAVASDVDEFNVRLLSTRAPVSVVSDRGFAIAELNERTIAAHEAVYDEFEGAEGVATEPDIRTGRIDMTVQLECSNRAAETVALDEFISRNSVLEGVVVSTDCEKRGGDDAIHRGGTATSPCTSGFTVVNSSGIRGMSTAGHCGNSIVSNGVTLSLVDEYESTYGDMQWSKKSGQAFIDNFYKGNSTHWQANEQDVSGVLLVGNGGSICKNGKVTDNECDTVKAQYHCYNGSCNLTRLENRKSSGGDSGGPVYWGSSAVGLHKGYNWWQWKDRDLYTRADLIPAGLGVNVATS